MASDRLADHATVPTRTTTVEVGNVHRGGVFTFTAVQARTEDYERFRNTRPSIVVVGAR